MSATEIIAELPKLNRAELEQLDARLHQLLNSSQPKQAAGDTICEVLLEFAGKAQGLPEDSSMNVDHYLYGVPKRQE